MKKIVSSLLIALLSPALANNIAGKITQLQEQVEIYPFEIRVFTQNNVFVPFNVAPRLEDGLLAFTFPAATTIDTHLQSMFGPNSGYEQCTKHLNEGAETTRGVLIDALYFTRPNQTKGILDLQGPTNSVSGSWMYVNVDQIITGRVDCPGISFTYDLNLQAGWNTIATTMQMQDNTLRVTQISQDTRNFQWQVKQ